MVKPASPMPLASCMVNLRPAIEALREPTMATTGRIRPAMSPMTAISGGALSMSRSAGG